VPSAKAQDKLAGQAIIAGKIGFLNPALEKSRCF